MRAKMTCPTCKPYDSKVWHDHSSKILAGGGLIVAALATISVLAFVGLYCPSSPFTKMAQVLHLPGALSLAISATVIAAALTIPMCGREQSESLKTEAVVEQDKRVENPPSIVRQRSISIASMNEMKNICPRPQKPRSYVSSPAGPDDLATFIRFDPNRTSMDHFTLCKSSDSLGTACTKNIVVQIGDKTIVLAEDYEGDSNAPQFVAEEFCAPFTGGDMSHRAVQAEIYRRCKDLDSQVREGNMGQTVLMGSMKVGDIHYIFNHSGGMVYLVKQNGKLICVTDYVLPDAEKCVPSEATEVVEGSIIDNFEYPIRTQSRLVFGGGVTVQAARGLGYREEVSYKPLITFISQKDGDVEYTSGEHLLFITRTVAQNVRSGEIEHAWQQMVSKGFFLGTDGCKNAAAALTNWFHRRADPEYGVGCAVMRL